MNRNLSGDDGRATLGELADLSDLASDLEYVAGLYDAPGADHDVESAESVDGACAAWLQARGYGVFKSVNGDVIYTTALLDDSPVAALAVTDAGEVTP